MACCSLASFATLSRSLGRIMVVVGNVRKIAWPRSMGGPDRPALTYSHSVFSTCYVNQITLIFYSLKDILVTCTTIKGFRHKLARAARPSTGGGAVIP